MLFCLHFAYNLLIVWEVLAMNTESRYLFIGFSWIPCSIVSLKGAKLFSWTTHKNWKTEKWAKLLIESNILLNWSCSLTKKICTKIVKIHRCYRISDTLKKKIRFLDVFVLSSQLTAFTPHVKNLWYFITFIKWTYGS